MTMRRLTFASLILLSISCATAPPPVPAEQPVQQPVTLDMRLLDSGTYGRASTHPSGSSVPMMAVATDDATYRQLWRDNVGDDDPPAVDFSRESAVFLLLGVRRTGGYRISLGSVSVDQATVVVSAPVITPVSGSMNSQAITAPFVIIAVSRPSLQQGEWLDAAGNVLATTSARPSGLPTK